MPINLHRIVLIAAINFSSFIFHNDANCAEIKTNYIVRSDYTEILIKGDILEGDDIKFYEATKGITYGRGIVVLDSPGGLLLPALEIGKMIRIKNYDTYIEDAACASACGLIWLAGARPTVGKNGRVGFHGAYNSVSSNQNESSRVGNALIGAYLAQLDLNTNAIKYITESSPNNFNWLSEFDSMKIGLWNVVFLDRRTVSIEKYNEAVGISLKEGDNSQRALRLYQESADNGFAAAQNNLGDRFEHGNGVEKNPLLAVYWYTRAAERGEPTAYYSLASILSKEDDLYSLTEAMKYEILSVRNLEEGKNKEGAKAIVNELVNKISPSRREAAEKLADQWAPLNLETETASDDPTP